MKVTHDDGFRHFQQFYLIVKSIKMFDEIYERIVFDPDQFHVEFDETVNKYIVLHISANFNQQRPICYLDNDNFSMKQFHGFFYSCLKEAWVEYLI